MNEVTAWREAVAAWELARDEADALDRKVEAAHKARIHAYALVQTRQKEMLKALAQ